MRRPRSPRADRRRLVRGWKPRRPAAGKVSRVFPVALLVLLGSGAYLVHKLWAFDLGWVDVAIAGVVLLFVVGGTIGARAARVEKRLAAATGPDEELGGLHEDLVIDALGWWNTGPALGIVFTMADKPSLLWSIVSLAIGGLVGVGVSTVLGGAPAGSRERRRVVASP